MFGDRIYLLKNKAPIAFLAQLLVNFQRFLFYFLAALPEIIFTERPL